MTETQERRWPVRTTAHRVLDRALTALIPADAAAPYRPTELSDEPEELLEVSRELPEVIIEEVSRPGLGGSAVLRKLFAFDSPCRSGVADNDTVRGYWITPSEGAPKASVVFLHGWKATSLWRLQRVARHATRLGVEVFLPAHPYHAWRRPKLTYSGTPMLTPDLDRTLRAVRQSVLDVRTLLRWVQARDHGPVLLAGVDLGALVAGLTATVHEELDGLCLISPFDRLSELLWQGRADRGKFREAMARVGVKKEAIDEAWAAIDPGWRPPLLPKERVLLVDGRFGDEEKSACAERLSERWGGVKVSSHNFAHADFRYFSKPIVHEALALIGVGGS